MTMVESLASGKPVIALGRGGAMDIVGNGCGVLYSEPNEACLEDALRSFDRVETLIHPAQLKIRAAAFSEAVFERSFRSVLNRNPIGRFAEKMQKSFRGRAVTKFILLVSFGGWGLGNRSETVDNSSTKARRGFGGTHLSELERAGDRAAFTKCLQCVYELDIA